MAEDKTRKPEELNDEQLDEVSGGGRFGPIIEHKPQ